MVSFLFKDEFYHINIEESRQTGKRKTVISKLQDSGFVTVMDSLPIRSDLSSMRPVNARHRDMYLHSFKNPETSGFISVVSDTVSVIVFE